MTLNCGLGLSNREAWRLEREAEAGFDRLRLAARLAVASQLRQRMILARARRLARRRDLLDLAKGLAMILALAAYVAACRLLGAL